MKNIIEINNLNFKYNNNIIFNNLNLKIEENSFTCIAGNNTSGKTTLIRLLGNLLPSNDSIRFGYSYINSDHYEKMGIVLGNNLDSFLFDDVYKEMTFPLENLNIDTKEIEKKVISLSKFFNISKLLDKKTYDLTNSEKQQLLIVISLLHNPKILLLDSPFSMMDQTTKKEILNKLLEYKKDNDLTIILTTVNLEDTINADYLYIINNGSIALEGKPLKVLKEDVLLNRLGLSLPFMVDLSLKLEFYELLDSILLDMNKMVDTLWK